MPHASQFIDETSVARMLARTQVMRPDQDSRIVIPPRRGLVTLNLTHAGAFTPWIPAVNKFLLAADVQRRSGTNSTSWVVGLQWSIMNKDYDNPITFSPVIQWASTTPATRNENIAAVPYVRFFVVTAESGADEVAKLLYAVE